MELTQGTQVGDQHKVKFNGLSRFVQYNMSDEVRKTRTLR